MGAKTYLGWTAWASTLVAFGFVAQAGGCAASKVVEDDGNDTTTTTTTTTGTSGGSDGTGGSGGGTTFPCGEDCSLIDTPACLQSVCNTGQYPGAVGACTIVPEDAGTACDDGLFCTVDDACDGMGACRGGPANDCGMGAGECTEVTCNESSKDCSATPLPSGTACTDPSDLCVIAGTCNANGECTPTDTKDCFFEPVPNECYVSQCNPQNGMCEAVPGNEGAPCTDQNDLCSENNTCTMGVCGGGNAKDCSALTQGCNLGQCNTTTGQCEAVAVPNGGMCDDLDICTSGETCQNGVCTGGTPTGNCQTFTYTGSMQTFVVPMGVTSINVAAWGAQGGGIGTVQGGLGGTTTGQVPVTPGETIYVFVGGAGTPGSGQACGMVGGFNGGGPTGQTCCSNAGGGAGSGGGASDIRVGGQTLADRVIVAAGGGGAGSGKVGANGGGLTGGDGQPYNNVSATGGNQTMGGAVGGHYTMHTCSMGTAGAFGVGGEGDGNDGGGGGGGWYGGGGGANNAGGGGGSSYYAATVVGGSTTSGVQTGNGEIIISW